MRIDKYISESGVASRKEAAREAKRGGVTVNGEHVKDLSRHIDPERDLVCYLGRELTYKKHVYVLLNKPEGYVSATEDSINPPVTDLLPRELQKRGLFPVGRLDKDTVGVMILTDEGANAHYLLSPRHHVEKEYFFRAAEPLPEGVEEQFRSGVTLADGYECKSAEIVLSEDRTEGRILLTEGKYHQIKRMIASFGNRVTYLERVRFAELPMAPLPARGEWRYLTAEEERCLKSFGGI